MYFKVQEILYQLLTFFIKVHHPKCINFYHKASYVFNEVIWIEQLYQIYDFVFREIQQSKNNSNPNFSNYISDLAVNIFIMVNKHFYFFFNVMIVLINYNIFIQVYCNESNFNISSYKFSNPKRKKIDISLLSFVSGLTKLKTSEICTR